MRPSDFIVALVGLALSSCAAKTIEPDFVGTWKLVGVECVDHQPGAIANRTSADLKGGELEETLVITAERVEQHVKERAKKKPAPDKYCETVFAETWNMRESKIHVSGSSFVSRNGVGGYKCSEPYKPKSSRYLASLPYRREGNRLSISYKDFTTINATRVEEHECKNGVGYSEIYEKQ